MKKFYTSSLIVLLMVSFTSLAFSQDREPNNTFKEADKITGLVIDGNIEYPGDVDWFYLMRQEGKQTIKFFVTHTLPDDITIEVYDGSVLVARLADAKSSESISCFVGTQKCWIKVWSRSNRSTGSYQITIIPEK